MSDDAFDLIKELSRNSEIIPIFNDNLFRSVLDETKRRFDENFKDALAYQTTRDTTLLPLVNYRHNLILRNKRCALTYLYNRLQKLKELRWNLGPILNADIKESLCESEIQWFNNYSNLLANYMLSLSDDMKINLIEDIKPPKSLFIEVRCLVDYGKLELNDGEIVYLKKNSQHYLPRIQCEQLIRQGILQHLE